MASMPKNMSPISFSFIVILTSILTVSFNRETVAVISRLLGEFIEHFHLATVVNDAALLEYLCDIGHLQPSQEAKMIAAVE